MREVVFTWFLGFFVSIVVGHYLVRYLNIGLRLYVRVEEGSRGNLLTPTLGCIERAIYTILFYLDERTLIAALFGIMIAQRLIAITKLEKKAGSTDRLELFREVGGRINVFIICNFASLFFGLMGGIIIKFLK